MENNRLLKEINRFEDIRVGHGWKERYTTEELESIYSCFELFEKSGGNNYRFNEVWLMKEFIENWDNWKENEQVNKLLSLIRKRGTRIA